MFQEDTRSFRADIPNEIRDRAEASTSDVARAIAAPDMVATDGAPCTPERRPVLQQIAAVLAGAALVTGGVVLGAVAGLLIVGAVLVVLASDSARSGK